MTTDAAHPLTEALGHAPADKRLEVLRRVGQTGSISQAARDAGISYKAAWQAIETLTNLSGLPLVERSVGGTGGGGARITPQGMRLLALADALAVARAQVLARFGPTPLGGGGASPGLGLRTSMRNQLPCVVTALQSTGHGPMVQVALQTVGGGQALTALLTRESADLLGLAPGLPVLALCKATAVAVCGGAAADAPGCPACQPEVAVPGQGVDAGGPVTVCDVATRVPGAGCVLAGVVADVSPDPGPQEVALTLPGGNLWVGFAADGAQLQVGDTACGRFAPSAVVIGLAG